ncbi:N-acetylmuramoyl-L-alanine amidase, partial [Gelidibacter sp.]|uniref:N-acetylmuramoyl-L-alanine amidase family protein n=1 Tax=Gelidibacter sp. TaxID=2018083 RepID=UPI003267C1C0
QNQFKKKLGFESRGVKFANFQVLRETKDYCPTLLLELGFLSNGDESSYFSNFNNIRLSAMVIFETIQKQ